ncbi:hypothetical protein N0V82_009243 [Gnomoniopsis sp. IMI 355080]|nr:hypothetical protein N0V82_009243 [Gnomoniopsis sp. IMI 355080]
MSPRDAWNRLSRRGSSPVEDGHHISNIQAHLVAATGEFVGTFFFLYMAYSGQLMVLNQYSSLAVAGGASSETIVFISLVYALSLLLIASMVAGGLVEAMYTVDVSVIGNVNTILVSGTSTAQGLFIEMFLTAQLVFVILMLAVEKSKDTFMAPIGIGLALFVAELSGKFLPNSRQELLIYSQHPDANNRQTGVFFTGGSLNPARSFGCAVAARSFPSYHWIYWLGPALGASLAALYYRFVKWAHYEEANPGQDSTGTDIEAGKNSRNAEV